MPSIQESIYQDLKLAIRDKRETELAALRLLKTEIQYELTKTGAKELSDSQMIPLLKKNISQRLESSQEYRKVGRLDLAAKEEKEREVIERYLPEEITVEQIEMAVQGAIQELRAQGPQDMGKVMGKVMGQFKGKNVDGSKVSEVVKNALQAKG